MQKPVEPVSYSLHPVQDLAVEFGVGTPLNITIRENDTLEWDDEGWIGVVITMPQSYVRINLANVTCYQLTDRIEKRLVKSLHPAEYPAPAETPHPTPTVPSPAVVHGA